MSEKHYRGGRMRFDKRRMRFGKRNHDYEAGYRDGSTNYELEHCPACKNVADLQEALDENAKLRKLVRGLDYCSDELNSAECDKCPLYDPADPILEPKCVRMMREMGIEMREIEIDKEEI